MNQSNEELNINEQIQRIVNLRETRSKRFSLMVLFVLWGFAFFLLLYSSYSFVGFIILIAFSFFGVELFRFLPEKEEFPKPIDLTKEQYGQVIKEYNQSKAQNEKSVRLNTILTGVFGLILPILSGCLYFFTENKELFSLLLALSLFILGIIFFKWIRENGKNSILREISINAKIKDPDAT